MTLLLAATLLTFLLAGFVKGVIGLGLPTISMGLLGLVMPPAEAAAILIIPSIVTNLWQMAGGRGLPALCRRLWPMFAGICLGTFAGAGLLTRSTSAVAWLGLALGLYALVGLAALRPRLPAAAERLGGLPVGAATGLITAATGIFVIPAVPFLQAIGLEKEDLVQALGLSFMVSTVALGLGLAHDGVFDLQGAGWSLLALLPALAGMGLGQAVRKRVSLEVFRRCFFAGLLLLGGYLALRGIP